MATKQLITQASDPPVTPTRPWSDAVETWRVALITEYGLHDDPAAIALLDRACACMERANVADAVLRSEGLTVEGRHGGVKAHPACAIAATAHAGFLASLRALRLDFEPAGPNGRPPNKI